MNKPEKDSRLETEMGRGTHTSGLGWREQLSLGSVKTARDRALEPRDARS